MLRAHQSPFESHSALHTLLRNRIGDNAGNLLFSHASHRLLSTPSTQIETSRLFHLSAEEVNEKYDAVVIPLANAFRKAFLPELERLTQLIEGLKVPVTVLGVNAQIRPSTGEPVGAIGEQVSAFVRAVLRTSPRVGVRGEQTAAYLKRLGFADQDVETIGCPSMFLYGPDLPTLRLGEFSQHSRVSLNLSPYAAGIDELVADHDRRYPNLAYTAQDIGTLWLLLAGEYESELKPKHGAPVHAHHPLLHSGRTYFPLNVPTWLDHLAGFDFSFGTRIHGNIAAVLAGTPAVVLTHDSRTAELADYHQLPHRRLGTAKGWDAERLYAETDLSTTAAAHPERWRRMAGFLSEQGLEHRYQDGVAEDDFDARLAQIRFPEVVRSDAVDFWHTTAAKGFRALRTVVRRVRGSAGGGTRTS
ncbi:polysaccharide pyruvyl transferase family protein [Propionicimonas paludicola]|uniref:polysaccharide pyruvyl transferase family protein n=1 Tax=Propionicimonas paludicola TaxID=185243 RepID=UPI0014742A20|nr:polysaccharide pyruvyl transferase family protein [Propionicimonas paludicola]